MLHRIEMQEFTSLCRFLYRAMFFFNNKKCFIPVELNTSYLFTYKDNAMYNVQFPLPSANIIILLEIERGNFDLFSTEKIK